MSNAEQQYAAIYGTYHPGEGQVIWSYLSDEHNLIYVCSDRGAFPTEIAASEVQA